MDKTLSPLAAFHLTGERRPDVLDDVGAMGLRPALFSPYRDLSTLRHDYPVVLVNGTVGGPFVRSLSALTDEALRETAPQGTAGERLRRHALRLEQEVRSQVSLGGKGGLSTYWKQAEDRLLAASDDAARETLSDSLSRLRASVRLDGEIVDCGEDLAAILVTHAWQVGQQERTRRLRERLDGLVHDLSDILRADHMRSAEGRDAAMLKRAVGLAYETVFDFDAMSNILGAAQTGERIPEPRRRRIEDALSVLDGQRFVAPLHEAPGKTRRAAVYDYAFDHCGQALAAFRKRLAKMADLVKAMAIAELEIENRYDDAHHGPFFDRFGAASLGAQDLASFPSYLVILADGAADAEEMATIGGVLSSALPIKILIQWNDVLDIAAVGSGAALAGNWAPRLAAMALGLNGAYVLQSGSAALYRLREPVRRGLANDGPALFSVFSGSDSDADADGSASTTNAPNVPSYLCAAAATESRAFPAFAFDPEAGADWASRFHLHGNPQTDVDWPVHRFRYEDPDHRKRVEDVAFTFIDFAASDRRYADHFAAVRRSHWHDDMVPASAFLELTPEDAAKKVPYVLMVDDCDGLHRAIVGTALIDAARRCRDSWRGLQELAGINNSHARNLLAEEKGRWQEEKEQELEALRLQAAAAPAAPASPLAAPVASPAAPGDDADVPGGAETELAEPTEAPAAPVDEPYIETPRCTTCNECTEINNRMFVYNDNMQAAIADADAGTFRQLVEAAESCQVAIIHPGKPRNPKETNLGELVLRAEPFNVV